MKTKRFSAAVLAGLLCVSAFAQDAKPQLKWYGFIRNYFVYDTHASSAGTEDLYYFMPVEADGKGTSNFSAITSRLGVDVAGYEVEGYKLGAKIETDFYNKNGSVAVLRLRQAFFTVDKDNRNWKVGQAWHPMAADLPDIFSLESAAPFGPFSRTPQVTFNYGLGDGMSLTASAIWQMQYNTVGCGVNGIKQSGIPELYLGFNVKSESNLARVGVDFLSLKPELGGKSLNEFNAYFYDQYSKNGWTFKEKLTYATDASHLNMVGGNGITLASALSGDHEFIATRAIALWGTISCKKGKHWMPVLLYGYLNNLGCTEDVALTSFNSKNSVNRVSQMYRIQPEIVYNLGKLQFGAEYMLTAVQYGTPDAKLNFAESTDLHWVSNNRFQLIAKYTF